jgi:hypothetical protein
MKVSIAKELNAMPIAKIAPQVLLLALAREAQLVSVLAAEMEWLILGKNVIQPILTVTMIAKVALLTIALTPLARVFDAETLIWTKVKFATEFILVAVLIACLAEPVSLPPKTIWENVLLAEMELLMSTKFATLLLILLVPPIATLALIRLPH